MEKNTYRNYLLAFISLIILVLILEIPTSAQPGGSWNDKGLLPYQLENTTGYVSFQTSSKLYLGLGTTCSTSNGCNPGSNNGINRNLFSWDGTNWTSIPTISMLYFFQKNTSKYFSNAFVVDNDAYIYGNNWGVLCSSDIVDIYEESINDFNDTKTCNIPNSGFFHRGGGIDFTVNNAAYIGLGYVDGTTLSSPLNDLWAYSSVTNSWTAKASFPGLSRHGAVSFVIGDNVYVGLGAHAFDDGTGNYSETYLNDFWMYSTVTNTWTMLPSFPGSARTGCASFALCKSGFVASGVDNGNTCSNELWEFDSVLSLWIRRQDIPLYTHTSYGQITKAYGYSLNSKGYIVPGESSHLYEYVRNPLSTGVISPTVYCSGQTVSFPYFGNCFNTGNVFTVQLSDASGSFSNPTNLGTVAAVNSGVISITIPINTPSGTGYRIRVVASSPYTVGTDNGVNITINQTITPTVGPYNDVFITDPSFQLTGGMPLGGMYTGFGLTATGIFEPFRAGFGAHTITYSVNGGCGTATTTINVVCPTGSLASFTNLTLSSAPLVLTGGLPTGGVYSGPGVTNGIFDPAVAGIGTHTITYTPYPGCPAVTNSITVTEPSCSNVFINPYHSVFGLTGPIYNFSPPHVKTAPFALTGGFPLGGVYSGPGVSNGVFDPAVAGNGIHTITYTYGNCPPVSTTITVLECNPTSLGGIEDEAQGDVVLDPELYCESSIQVDDLSPKIFCAGENRILQFTEWMGNSYPTIYRAYLMDASGTNVVSGIIGTYTATNSSTSGAFSFPIQIPLGTPAGTYKIRIDGSYGSYNYNGIPSSYTITVGPVCTENSEVTDIQVEASAICSSENLKFSFTTTEFQNHSPYTIQLSDPNGSFSSTAVTYYLGSIYSTGLTTNVTMPIPNVPVGSNYKIRVIGPSGVSTVLSSTFSIGVISCTALEYDGINDVSTITSNSVYDRGNGDFTVEAWVKMSSAQTNTEPVIISRGSATTSDGFALYTRNGGTQFSFRFTYFTSNPSQTFPSIHDDQCHHVAVVRSGTALNYYIDGALVIATSISSSKGISGGGALCIGNDINNSNPFKGEIHEVRFWNVARTTTQIQNNTTALLSSGTTGLRGYWKMKELGGQVLTDASVTANNAGWLGTNNTIEDTDPVRISTTCHANDRLGDVNEEDNENDLHSGLRVYPNPFEESFTILALSEEVAWMDVEIMDIQGHQVYQGKLETDTAHKLVLPIPNGMYIVVATCGDRVYRYKVMKSN